MVRYAGHHASLLGRHRPRALRLDEYYMHGGIHQRYWRLDPEATVHRQLHRQCHSPQHFLRHRPLVAVQGTALPKQNTARQGRNNLDNSLRRCWHRHLDPLVNHRYNVKQTAISHTATAFCSGLLAHRRLHLLGIPTAKQKSVAMRTHCPGS